MDRKKPITKKATKTGTKPKAVEQEKAIAIRREDVAVVPQTQTDVLIQLAANKDFPVEKLTALIDLKNREEDREAKKEFNLHFAEMQSELPMITKRGKNDYLGNPYALLEDMVEQCKPIINRHKFSYRWNQKKLTDNTVLASIFISGYGHTEETSMEMNILEPPSSSEGKKATNKNQQRGSTDSYAHRYLFKAAFGIVEKGLDDDGNGGPRKQPEKKQEYKPQNTSKPKPETVDPDAMTPEERQNIESILTAEEKKSMKLEMMAAFKLPIEKQKESIKAIRAKYRKLYTERNKDVEDTASKVFDADPEQKEIF
jgi:hypothetical protein